MFRCLSFCCLISVTTGLFGQSPEIELPALGAGPFQSTDQSHWSLFRNMAGTVNSENCQIVLGYQLPYNLKELQSLALGILIPGAVNVGASLFQSGTDNLINQQAAVTSSMSFGKLNLGIRVKYWRVAISGITSLSSISADAGVQIELTDQVLAGVFISNLTQSQLGENEIIPVIWQTGISYKPTAKLSILIETGHVLGHHWEFKSGIEYRIKKRLLARTGYNISNKRHYWGLGFLSNSIELDYAIDFHPYLGITQQAGFCYSWP